MIDRKPVRIGPVARRLALALLASLAWVRPAAAAVQVSPGQWSFGSVMLGTSSPERWIYVRNLGPNPVKLRALHRSGANPDDFGHRLTMCPVNPIPPGGQCGIEVWFVPAAVGSRTAQLEIYTELSTIPETVPLDGTGLAQAPVLDVSPKSLSFGSQAVGSSSAPQSVTLYNTGLDNMTINAISINPPGEFVSGQECDGALVMYGRWNQCTFTVSFSPQGSGTRKAVLTISSDGGTKQVDLEGSGAVPVIRYGVTSLNFGSLLLGTTGTKSLTVINDGDAALEVKGASISGPADFLPPTLTSSPCFAAPQGGSCQIEVRIRPREEGARAAMLTVTSNAPSAPSLPLAGFGVLPPVFPIAPNADDHNFLPNVAPTPAGACVFRSGGPVTFPIAVERVVTTPGFMNLNGTLKAPTPLVGSGIISKEATLELLAYNVNSPAATGSESKHEVLFNGQSLGFLKGQPGAWAVSSFKIPIEQVRFPFLAPLGSTPSATNSVEVTVDTTNAADTWCTAVAWAHLSFKATSPVIMIHGDSSNGAIFTRVTPIGRIGTFLTTIGVPNDNSINLAAAAGGTATIAANALELQMRLPGVVRRFGVDSVHIVAHSKGGLDTRSWLGTFSSLNTFKVISLTTLSTPHLGSPLADAIVALRATGIAIAGLGASSLSFIPVGPSIPDMTTTSAAAFNPTLPGGADYRMLGADGDSNANGKIDSFTTSAVDEWAEARIERPALAAIFAASPTVADGLATEVYKFMRTTSAVRVVTTTIGVGPFTVATITTPLAVAGGGPNDLLVGVSSATGAKAPFTVFPFSFAGGTGRDHAGVTDSFVGATVLPFLQATEATRGDFK
jgi:hypothetical protein